MDKTSIIGIRDDLICSVDTCFYNNFDIWSHKKDIDVLFFQSISGVNHPQGLNWKQRKTISWAFLWNIVMLIMDGSAFSASMKLHFQAYPDGVAVEHVTIATTRSSFIILWAQLQHLIFLYEAWSIGLKPDNTWNVRSWAEWVFLNLDPLIYIFYMVLHPSRNDERI
jgi:hypothetical protein